MSRRRYARARLPRLEGLADPVDAEETAVEVEDESGDEDGIDPTLRSLAATKSYTTSAVIVFFLYLLFWFPGLIFNLVYYNDAKRMERLAGQSLPGAGCLTAMLVVNVLLAALALFFLCRLTVLR